MSRKNKSTEETAISPAPLVNSIPTKEKKMNSHVDTTMDSADATPSLEKLISWYEETKILDQQLWSTASDIEDSEEFQNIPIARVVVAHFLRGELREPEYAYSNSSIDLFIDKSLNHLKTLFPNSMHPHQRAKLEDRRSSLKAELAQMRAVENAGRDKCGYTAAIEKANDASGLLKSLANNIIAHRPTALCEVGIAARFLIEQIEGNPRYLDPEDLVEFVRTLASHTHAREG